MTRLRATLPAAAAALLCGCFATQHDVLNLSQQTDSMSLQVHNVKKIMTSLQANQADLNEKLDQMHKDVTILNENLVDNREAMSRLSAKMDDLGAAIGSKVSSLDNTLAARLGREEAERRRLAKKQKSLEDQIRLKARQDAALRAADAARRAEEKKRRMEAAAGPTPSDIYHRAYIQLNQEKYELAAAGFEVYLDKYPKGAMADLAAYNLGQALFSQKKWEDAARRYAFVLDRYPKSEVTPAARMRYAVSLIKMKTALDEAERYLESIPEDFPNSPEAKKAAELLKTWRAKKKAAEEAKKKKKKPEPKTKKSGKTPAKKTQ